ncbi:hypothetical protein PYW07_010061 [Mythimna separata]|uniref:Peptidase S1 domain-containing protein n=1 Tax=Mythimna separata TaxID=271217 RepID=A0AAD8DQN4_MYTSE|nr:hypothetical protein PYW07_010061 [Mythimna separata]
MIIYVSHCQRRIIEGQDVKKDRKFVVYLAQAHVKAIVTYDTWVCGGAIVTSEFVVTAAACVSDVEFLYVIAGYKNYVPDNQIETDKCTSTMRKKVTYTCIPKFYDLKYDALDGWAGADMALIKVESPFDFNDPKYETLCSYKPSTIPINYDQKYQEPGDDALVFGWGHTEMWRIPGDTHNYNQQGLKYAPILIMNKTACSQHYAEFANFSKIITKYMICSLGKGNIDDEGRIIQQSLPQQGCTTRQQKLLGFEGISCESLENAETRRSDKGSNRTNNVTLTDFNITQARRSGFCQNDHGGPLTTWAGASEILIGVASVFKVTKDYECMGPYLYTSTACMGIFLNCVLESDELSSRRHQLCDKPAIERGYDTIERTISWKNHPAGAADNENEIIGRSGPEPKPKLSPGLKYLIKNNQEMDAGNENLDSNKQFQSYKVPPIVSNASNTRFIVQKGPKSVLEKKEPLNDGYQVQPESNKMYLANKSPVPISNELQDRFTVKERNPETKHLPEKHSLRMNDRASEKTTSLVNGRSSDKQTFSANEKYSLNLRQGGNERNPPSMRDPRFQSHLINQRYPENQKYPVVGRYQKAFCSFETKKNNEAIRNNVEVAIYESATIHHKIAVIYLDGCKKSRLDSIMSLNKIAIFFFILIYRVTYGQRRIVGGENISSNKSYMVYFAKASLSARNYDNWICGGALVTAEFIITSAACVEDVRYLYAIAGTNKYVPIDNLKDDPCAYSMKKKVIFTCVPTSYEFDFDRVEKWSMIDIALARVESPYDFKDTSILEVCPHMPGKIPINYDPKYQLPGTDCMVMGWGHEKLFRKETDTDDHNVDILRYTSTLILDQEKCIKGYEYYPKMQPIISEYMICTDGEGSIDDSGLSKDDPSKSILLDGCKERRMYDNSSCNEQNDNDQNIDFMNTRRRVPQANRTYYNYTTQEYIRKAVRQRWANRTRRNGICQNDHGGPLVTWVGTSEVLIGVASVFQIDEHFNCIGPYLHTSTKNNGGFIDCVLNEWAMKRKRKPRSRRSSFCDSPPHIRGFDTIEQHISWKDHPAGPAENELHEARFKSINNNEQVVPRGG